MKMTDKIDVLMKRNNISNHNELSKLSRVPYTTIRGLYDYGYHNVKLQTLLKLAKVLGCTLDYIADDDLDEEKRPSQMVEPKKEESINGLLSKMKQLNPDQRKVVEQMIELAARLRTDQ